jgi:hypothetical protein
LSTATEFCELKVVGRVIARLLLWFEHSLQGRRKLLVLEIAPRADASRGIQAGLLDLSIARFKRGIELLQHGGCKNARLLSLLASLHGFQDQLSVDVNTRLRNASANSHWRAKGMHLIDKAVQEIVGFKKDASRIGIECDDYE